jgi:conjugal transfer pilus assembly protein TraW
VATFLRFFGSLFLLILPLYAKDFGTLGHTFPIQEEDLLMYLKKRLEKLSAEEMFNITERIKQHYLKMAQEPSSICFEEAREYKVYYFDPSITVARDIPDHKGNIIIQKGTTINPLAMASLGGELLFLDSTNASHIKWARQQSSESKWILVKGKSLELEEQEGRPIYFDQFGYLTRKLDIQHIPARVSQEKGSLKIKIEEIPICKST